MDIGVGVGLFPAQHRKQMRQRHQEWPQNLALVGMNPSCLQKSATRIDYPGKTAYLRCTCCIVCSANRTQDHCICESKTGIFGNADDSSEIFVKALEDEFEEVETHIVDVALLFRAYVRPQTSRVNYVEDGDNMMNFEDRPETGITNLVWRLNSGSYVYGYPEDEVVIRRPGFATGILPQASSIPNLLIDMEENPCQIQSGLGTNDLSTPLILFHDAGGTVFPYFCLGDLHRPLYGISNSHFDQGGKWDHGIRQMGVVYSHLLRSVIKSGDVILGGWSLGGCVALEVASRLMKLPQYTVQGVIMIDSVFPTSKVTDRYPRTIAEVAASFQLPTRMSDARRVQAQQCILYAHEMQRDWRPPLFPSGLPPTVLIRAADPVHLDPDAKPHYLDLIRNWTYLGWEEYDRSFIQSCLVIPGNHFTIFDDPHCHQTTTKIREACAILARPQQPNPE
ncbi:alpha/beta-hydrolase [Aspergillus niger ATCC 13496]|uniref:Alpha/beta-hydrolase n=1 Tax=Aspergillus niger ATCC 13496 TaxID=1353008 RepID=A0A370BXR2_ASPNG|nr:alpha/beta-hydrolase [Aspergillus niger ATCC 13496]